MFNYDRRLELKNPINTLCLSHLFQYMAGRISVIPGKQRNKAVTTYLGAKLSFILFSAHNMP